MIYRIIFFITLLFVIGVVKAQDVPLAERGICAHRGAMDTHPENTLAAFREAVRLGVQMIEFDVRMTKDGQLVILHDETVDRTTNGSGKLEDLTLKEVMALDAGSWKNPEFQGERVPTLIETLEVIPENIWLNVHLKGGRELGMKTAKVLIEKGRTRKAFIACGLEAANGAHLISPEINICNMERQTDNSAYIRGTIEYGSEFIQFYKIPVGPEINVYSQQLKAHDIRINYCCTDDPDAMKSLFELGVDFVLVNQPKMMLKSAKEMGFYFSVR